MNYKKLLYILILPSLLWACQHEIKKREFVIEVNAISDNKLAYGAKYTILPANKDVSPNDLQFKEYKNLINKILQNSGYRAAKSKKESEIIIYLYYGISNPQEKIYSYSTPIFGQTGIASSNTHGSITNMGNYGSYSATTNYTPTYGISGYANHVGTYTYYTRTLVLSAVKNAKNNEETWRVTVESTGSSNDLRVVMPALAIAAETFLGQNSYNKITIRIAEDDQRIRWIREESINR